MLDRQDVSPIGILQATKATSRRSVFNAVLALLRGIPLIPAVIVFLLAFSAIFANFVAPHDPVVADLRHKFAPPFWMNGGSGDNILGTDHLGRDILSRMIYGARISLTVSFFAIVAAAFFGTSIGLIAGYIGGKTDAILMRLTDIMLALPYILIAIVIVAILGASLTNIIAVIALTTWANYARIIRAEVLVVKESDFVALAKVAGCAGPKILIRHVFPNVVNTLIVLATLQVGTAILFESALSFLGMGVPPPNPTWGTMVADGRNQLATAWWLATIPGLGIMLTVLAMNLLGDWLRDTLDPARQRA